MSDSTLRLLREKRFYSLSRGVKRLKKCPVSHFTKKSTSNSGHRVGISNPKLTDHHEISAEASAASNALLRPV